MRKSNITKIIRSALSIFCTTAILTSSGCISATKGNDKVESKAQSNSTTSSKEDNKKLDPPPELKKKYFLGISPGANVNIPEEEWQSYKELGVKTLRIHIQLSNIGYNQAFPKFRKYDVVIDRAIKEDIEVVLLLSYESYKSQSKPLDLGWGNILNFKDDCMNLIPMVKSTITHFKGKVKKYEIWNEQNGMWNIEVDKYSQLLTDLYEKCKYTEKWDEEAIIGFGGLDAVNVSFDDSGTNQGSIEYFTNFYETKAYKDFKKKYGHSPFDAVAVHPYNTLVVNEKLEVDYNKLANAVKLTIIDPMTANGDSKIPIWITEYGNQDADDEINAKSVYEGIKEIYKIPQVETLHWFKYTYGGADGKGYSIVTNNGEKRKSYYSFRQAAIDIAKEEQSK